MNLLEEIRDDMAVLVTYDDAYSAIEGLKNTEYPAWCVKYENQFGVAVERGNYKDDLYIEFSNSKIISKVLMTEDGPINCLMLLCADFYLRYAFSAVATAFVDPGENGKNRKLLTNDPEKWALEWRDLLGNAIYEKRIYSILGELIILEHLFKKDNKTCWSAVNGGTHDIEYSNGSAEVKSTLQRYGSTVTISGQHQLKSNNGLDLYFIRMEESNLGVCINDMIKLLVDDGYDENRIEVELRKLGIMPGSIERKERYKILEKRKYKVDNNFPKITNESFKNDMIPENILHIVYSIDLDGLNYEKW